ncbi:cytochrome P460 family protein [Microbulbifer sp. RZ01]|uniref:cytochrome P460 family protein n=2 Tax=unclassified Microbulbifer TaxID=2619833 RepID=UPI0027E5A544|nr:cytochrome P460 family protein [Microbulbifer sp. RZ01]
MIRPGNIDQWIFLGATVGHGYPDGESRSFSLNSPGMIQIVQMEPGAYRYLKQHGNYADGTMLSLSFYNTQEKPSPAVDGVVQKDLASFEIHILDREKYSDKRAFFLFQNGDNTAGMIPKGNACIDCHEKDAEYDGTFVQFYPVLRDRLLPEGL